MAPETIPSSEASKEEKKIDSVSKYHEITDADKREGISTYGEKPLDATGTAVPSEQKTAEDIREELRRLEEKWKSTDYVGDKSDIEHQILELEKGLRTMKSEKLKTAKELAMEGNIAWDKGGNEEGKEVKKDASKPAEAPKKPEESPAASEEKTPVADGAEKPKEDGADKGPEKAGEASGGKKDAAKKETLEKAKNKEALSEEDRLNAAEILCKYQPGAHETPEEEEAAKKRALEGLSEFSEDVIAKASEVAGIRNKLRDLEEATKIVKQEYKTSMDNPSINQNIARSKYEQRLTNIRRQMRLLNNDFDPALKDLKVEYLRTEGAKLKKYETHEDFPDKVKDLELSALGMVSTELLRWQDAEVRVNRQVNPKGWDHVVNFFSRVGESKSFQRYQKMGRLKRTAYSTAVIGGATALLMPSAIAAAGIGTAGYLVWRGARSLVGGTASYWVSKKIVQPFVRKTYEHDEMADKARVEAKTGQEVKDLKSLIEGNIGDKSAAETLKKIADANFKLATEYAGRMKRNKKMFLATNTISSILTGLVVGGGTARAMDHLFDPWLVGIAGGGTVAHHEMPPSKGGGDGKEIIPPAAGGAHEGIAQWNLETAKPGDSVWRVIERDLQHNMKGFNDLPKAEQTYIIDHYKDLVVADPEKFGLHDPNVIQPGWGKEIHTLFDGKGGRAELDRWAGKAGSLTPEQRLNIDNYHMKATVFHPDAPVDTAAPEAVGIMSGAKLHETVEAINARGVTNNLVEPQTYPGAGMRLTEAVPSRADILLNLHDAAPHFEEYAENFPHLSLAEQEHVLSSEIMEKVTGQISHLNHMGANLTGSETQLMGSINKSYTSMLEVYQENARHFAEALHRSTGLTAETAKPFLSTGIDKVLDAYKGNDRVLDFVKNVNPTSNELAAHVSVEQVLKNRFTDGHFGTINLDNYFRN